MKVALLLAGQLRYLDKLFQNQTFIKLLNCDIFIATDNFDYNTKTIISREKVITYAETILGEQLKDCYIEDDKDINFLLNLHKNGNALISYDERNPTSLFSGREAVYRMIMKGYNMIERYEKLNSFKYDIFIRSRSDLVLYQSILPFFQDMNNFNELALLKRTFPNGIKICDSFVICKRHIAEKYANTWYSIRTHRPPSPEQSEDKILKETNIGCNFACMEKQLYRHIINNNLNFVYINDYIPELKHGISRGNYNENLT
jgi:hypothetical protein